MPRSNHRCRRLARPLAAALGVLLAGCSPEAGGSSAGADEVPEGERYGGTLVVAHSADLQTMNAFTVSQAESVDVQQNVLFMPLLRYGADRVPHPRLAESWDTTHAGADSLELTFRLRRDVRWHDGVPTTAADVLFTFERAKDPRTGSPTQSLLDLWNPRAEALDSFTVRFRLRAHEQFLAVWELPIMPRHILGEARPEELGRHPFGHTRPVGNGPFRFLRRTPGQEWVFEANADFPRALGGRPYLDRLVIRVIPDATTRLTELLTGEVQVITPFPSQAAQVEGAPGVTLRDATARRWVYVGWNTRDPLFRDARVRRALSLAIDREAIVDAVLQGHGEVGISTTAPVHWQYDEDYRRLAIRPDREGARALLREAGWSPGPDGVLRDAAGRRFEFDLLTIETNEIYRDVGPIVQAQLRPLGIVANPRGMEANALFAILDGTPEPGGGRRRDFQAVTSGWFAGHRHDDAAIFHSRHRDGPYAETGFSDPRLDVLIDSLNVEMDRTRARRLWQEYHLRLMEAAPYAVLLYQAQLLAHRDAVRGVEFDVRGPFAALAGAWLAASGAGAR